MGLTLISLIALAAAIYLSCEFFVNAIEWLGQRFNFGASIVGAILAAFGTALPESAVTFVAVVFGRTPASRDVGVGAALGGPLVLATIAYAVVGLTLMLRRRTSSAVPRDDRSLARDQMWFLWIFVAKVALGFFAFAAKPWLSLAFVAAYAVYVWILVRDDRGAHVETDDIEPLRIRPHRPTVAWATTQTVVSLIVIGVASRAFVAQLEDLGAVLHLAPHIVALLLSPIATELPETMNAIIWVRQGKERLAFANISGAMMIQATIPSALGIAFTPWIFDAPLVASAVATALAIIWLWWNFRSRRISATRLIATSAIYALFAASLAFLL